MTKSKAKSGRLASLSDRVLFFVPNLIGYSRIILAGLAFYCAPFAPYTYLVLYFFSCIADALDGYAARYFNQSTKFGAILDMITDRCTTSCLLMNLAVVYSQRNHMYILVFQLLLALDITSHWLHMYTTMMRGRQSHKEVTNPWLRLYYSKPILFTLCFANETFFALLYMVAFDEGPTVPVLNIALWKFCLYICAPLCAIKQWINIVQLHLAIQDLVSIDVAERKAIQSTNGNKKN